MFYGVRDQPLAAGVPARMQLFFPSLDGSPSSAPILEGCGRYPVVLFAHGDCSSALEGYYRKWFDMPVRLARSGYVVVVPELPNISAPPTRDHPALGTLTAVLRWIRERWEHRDVLLPAPATGVVGHSFGALHASHLAATTNLAAYASLSGVPEHPRSILDLRVPKLFIWGGVEDLLGSTALSDEVWKALTRPKHRAAFAEGAHWDYLGPGHTPCASNDVAGPCRNLYLAAADLATMFFAKYVPPELSPDLPARVADSLIPPPSLHLTTEQEFYAAGHLAGWKLIQGKPGCEVSLAWRTPGSSGSIEPTEPEPTERTVPSVLELSPTAADRRVRDAGLVPRFTGPTNPGTPWVFSQSPTAGTKVPAGSTVSMSLRTGPRR